MKGPISAPNVVVVESRFGLRIQQRFVDGGRDIQVTINRAITEFDLERAEVFAELRDEERDGVANELRYAGYIERQQREAKKARGDEELCIPATMSYGLPGLSREMTEKLSCVRPASIGQASRIPGVTPAAIAILRMHVRRGATRAARA